MPILVWILSHFGGCFAILIELQSTGLSVALLQAAAMMGMP